MLCACSAEHHFLNAIGLEENIMVGLHCILKCLVGHNLRLALHERLEAIHDCVEVLLADFWLSLCHVIGLFAIEGVGNASGDEDVELNALFAFLLLDFLTLGEFDGVFLLASEGWRG